MSNHTPGPWSYEKGAGHYELSIVITAPGMPANSPLAVISDICGDAEQDARRIVECVNSFDLLIAQRDELLAALKLAKEMFISNELVLPRTFEVIDEAIAKAVQS